MENEYSQDAIKNINRLLKPLKKKLSSNKSITDKQENIVYIDGDIFSIETLVSALASSLTLFNECPLFSRFSFDETGFIDEHGPLLIEGAFVILLGTRSLIEAGKKEFVTKDDGISFSVPTISELLTTSYSVEIQNYCEKVKRTKSQ